MNDSENYSAWQMLKLMQRIKELEAERKAWRHAWSVLYTTLDEIVDSDPRDHAAVVEKAKSALKGMS